MRLESKFHAEDRVLIDGAPDVVAVVSGFVWRGSGVEVEVQWLSATLELQTAIFLEARLSLVEEREEPAVVQTRSVGLSHPKGRASADAVADSTFNGAGDAAP